MASSTPSSPLLRLPKELRYEIYDLLCRQEPKSFPFPVPQSMLISFIDQRAPPTDLSMTCRFLCDETRSYFYSKVTLAFHSTSRERSFPLNETMDPIILRAIQNVRKIRIRVNWSHLHESNIIRKDKVPYQTIGWLADLVDLLLREAEMLEVVTLCVYSEMSSAVGWELKAWILKPLERLAGRVRWRLGDVMATQEDEAALKEQLIAYLEELNGGAALVVEPDRDPQPVDSCCTS
ncbi:hypothetical protein BKA58DRAFT_443830 [Alternaria rosae]|uniref:uncharacterized protein n=1 Tax=Alternaria rosae TaxID=1187941 RepID=UPI001E8DE25D|nr:uncharacterized protein BKA58DRAFT_443830 [Alternaria rosae]KAH6861059.1 hypothetical protein BKA58DRAFT_443830 [Alternaria rosae]